MTHWLKVEPIFIPFRLNLTVKFATNSSDGNSSKLKQKMAYSKAKLEALVKECMEAHKLSFTDTVIELGVSPTTVRRICRTLKMGRYSDQIPSERRSNSSQQPYGWKSVNGILEKEPNEWQCVEMMFQLRGQGMSLHKIAAEFADRKIPTKNGGRWFAKSISQILKFNEKFLIKQPNDRRIK